jgi:phosphopantetheinyl transferase
MSPVSLPVDDVHLWWSEISEVRGRSVASRRSSVDARHTATRAACESIVSVYDRRAGIARVPGRKPIVTGVDLQLSYAYGRSIVAVAVSRCRSIGIDVESSHARVDETLARNVLSVRELERLVELPPSHRRAAVLRAWVRKEAVLKASGVGLLVEPSRLDVGIGELNDTSTVVGVGVFRIVDLRIEGHVCALAAAGEGTVHVRPPRVAPIAAADVLTEARYCPFAVSPRDCPAARSPVDSRRDLVLYE